MHLLWIHVSFVNCRGVFIRYINKIITATRVIAGGQRLYGYVWYTLTTFFASTHYPCILLPIKGFIRCWRATGVWRRIWRSRCLIHFATSAHVSALLPYHFHIVENWTGNGSDCAVFPGLCTKYKRLLPRNRAVYIPARWITIYYDQYNSYFQDLIRYDLFLSNTALMTFETVCPFHIQYRKAGILVRRHHYVYV